jgi:hypothetical protein
MNKQMSLQVNIFALICLLTISLPTHAKKSKAESIKPTPEIATIKSNSTSRKSMQATKGTTYLGYGITFPYGDIRNIRLGYFWSPNNAVEFNHFKDNPSFDSFNEILHYSISNKYMLGYTFYIGTGLYRKDLRADLPAGFYLKYNGNPIDETELVSYGATVTMGNLFVAKKGFAYSIDWLTIRKSLYYQRYGYSSEWLATLRLSFMWALSMTF